eukprot:363369-Chlamydomonas_euryale.AAC.12
MSGVGGQVWTPRAPPPPLSTARRSCKEWRLQLAPSLAPRRPPPVGALHAGRPHVHVAEAWNATSAVRPGIRCARGPELGEG